MRRCVVHVGMPKTGTTSIQESLFHTRALEGAHFIHTGQPNSGADLCSVFRSDPYSVKFNQVQGLTRDEIQHRNDLSLNALIEGFSHPHDTFILSGEGLVSMDVDDFQRLSDWLRKYVDRVQVVGYVRDAKGLMESSFQQSLKGGGVSRLNLANRWPAYRQTFEKFDLVLGRENVDLWKFEPRNFHNNDVVSDFCQRLNLHLPSEDIVRANDALSLDAVSLLYVFCNQKIDAKALKFGEYRQIKRLVKAVSALPGAPLKFRTDALKPIFEAQSEDIQWMEARLGDSVSHLPSDQPAAIASEHDLLNPGATAVAWLARAVGADIPQPNANAFVSSKQIADWMDQLGTARAVRAHPGLKGASANERLKRKLRNQMSEQKRSDDPGA